MAKRKSILGLLTAFFLCVSAICFVACGESKTISSISVGVADVQTESQNSICVERSYGNTSDLNNFVITATYSDNSTKTLDIEDVEVTVSVDGVDSTLTAYQTAIENGGLSIGGYVLVFSYKDFNFTVNISVLPAEDVSTYTINLNSTTRQMGGKTISGDNTMFFGTRYTNISFGIYNGNQQVQSVAESSVYVLAESVDGYAKYLDVSAGLPEDLKTPAEYYEQNLLLEMSADETSDDWSILQPGKYLVCANIKIDANHNATFSQFKTITVEKAPFVVENDIVDETNLSSYKGIKFDWNYNFSREYKSDVTLSYMISSRSTYVNEGFSGDAFALVLCQDDNTLIYKNKIALTNIVDTSDQDANSINNILHYGDFVAVAEDGVSEVLFNAVDGYKKVKVKFVPNETYQNLYTESAPFDMLIKVNPGEYYMIPAEISSTEFTFDQNGQAETKKLTISSDFEPFQISYSSGIDYSYNTVEGRHEFSTTNAGSYSATFKFKGDHNNFFWRIPSNLATSGYTYTANTINYNGVELITSITYSWTISKLNLTDNSLGFYIFDDKASDDNFHIVNESTGSQSVFALYLGAGCGNNSNINLTANGVTLNWAVKPVNTTNDAGQVSTVTGELQTYENKDSNLFKKIVLTTGNANDGDYVYLAVEISFAGNQNIALFSKIFVIELKKVDYVEQLNLTRTLSVFTDPNTQQSYLYFIDSIGQEFSVLTSSFDNNYYTYSIMSLSTYENIEDFSQPMQTGHYQIVFKSTTDKPYLKGKTYEFWILGNEPSLSEDFIG